MGQFGPKMRRTTEGFTWWCPACGEPHPLPKGWKFDGNAERPTFSPSFKHTGHQTVVDGRGNWTGEFKRGPDGKLLPWCCHYIVTAGRVAYCGDCTHAMAGQTIEMPDLPAHMRD